MKLPLTLTALLSTLLLSVVPAPTAADVGEPVIDPCENTRLCDLIDVCRTVEECCDRLGFQCDLTTCQTVEECCYQLNIECGITVCRPVTRCCEYFDPNPCDCLTRDCLALPQPYVRDNGDGTYTVGYNTCGGYYGCDNDLATVSTNPCDYGRICDRYIPQPYVRDNGDGTYTVGYRTCEYSCDHDLVTVNGDVCDYAPCGLIPDDLCYTYNPYALTNMCITTSSGSQPVTHPSAEVTSRRTCIIGEEGCVNHAWVNPTTTTTYVPVYNADGYFELTVACGFGAPCRVTLP